MSDTPTACFLGCVFVVFALFIGFVAGSSNGVSTVRKEAVKAGHAEWSYNPKLDNFEFRWK